MRPFKEFTDKDLIEACEQIENVAIPEDSLLRDVACEFYGVDRATKEQIVAMAAVLAVELGIRLKVRDEVLTEIAEILQTY